MRIEKKGHYIVRVLNNSGVQYAHMELPEGYDTDQHGFIQEIHAGPHDDELQAWAAHRERKAQEAVK